jgi:hypothetical protein
VVLAEIRPRLHDEHDDREGEDQRTDHKAQADFADARNSGIQKVATLSGMKKKTAEISPGENRPLVRMKGTTCMKRPLMNSSPA